MRRPLRSGLTRGLIAFAVTTAVCALLCALSWGAIVLLRSPLEEQRAARWFAPEKDAYLQFSVFLDTDASFTPDSVLYVRQSLESSFAAASIIAPSKSARVFLDAYSCEGTIYLEPAEHALNASGFTATVTAVGGDFFYFHRLRFLSGQPIYSDDYTLERIVLDESAAWKLCGSVDIAGMTVRIGDTPYEIAGVVEKADTETYGSVPRVYLSYEAYAAYLSDEPAISCYELLLPEPFEGFAQDRLKSALSMGDGQSVIVRNEARFRLFALIRGLGDLPKAGIRDNRIVYPHWENHAVTVLAKCTLLSAVFAVFAVIGILILAFGFVLGLVLLNNRLSDYRAEKKRRHDI